MRTPFRRALHQAVEDGPSRDVHGDGPAAPCSAAVTASAPLPGAEVEDVSARAEVLAQRLGEHPGVGSGLEDAGEGDDAHGAAKRYPGS